MGFGVLNDPKWPVTGGEPAREEAPVPEDWGALGSNILIGIHICCIIVKKLVSFLRNYTFSQTRENMTFPRKSIISSQSNIFSLEDMSFPRK